MGDNPARADPKRLFKPIDLQMGKALGAFPAINAGSPLKLVKPPWISSLNEATKELSERFAAIGRLSSELLKPYQPCFAELSRIGNLSDVIQAAGWLPHYSTPFDEVEACEGDVAAVHAALTRYYEENWSEIREAFDQRLTKYDLPQDTKALWR